MVVGVETPNKTLQNGSSLTTWKIFRRHKVPGGNLNVECLKDVTSEVTRASSSVAVDEVRLSGVVDEDLQGSPFLVKLLMQDATV